LAGTENVPVPRSEQDWAQVDKHHNQAREFPLPPMPMAGEFRLRHYS